ncbi:MAG: PilZ domain-containing protein [Pseudomonadota bacterium]
MKYSKHDRRKYPRIDTLLNARFIIIGKSNEKEMISRTINATTKTISTSGVCLKTNVVQVDGLHICSSVSGLDKNKLNIEIDLPPSFGSINAIGEVSWYDLMPENDDYLYCVGVAFIELSEDDMKVLNSYITKQIKERKTRLGFLHKWISLIFLFAVFGPSFPFLF